MFGWLRRIFGGKRNGGEPGGDLKSLVWLIEQPRTLTLDTVLILARRAFGDELIDVHEVPKNPELPGDMFIVVLKPQVGLGVISAHRPYVEDPEKDAESIPERRRATLFGRHRAWLAVDVMGSSSKAAYKAVGKLLACLAGPDCLLLYSTELRLMEPYSDELIAKLNSGNPLSAVQETEHAPIVDRPPDDQELAAAAAEAHRTWPDFVNAFHTKDPNCVQFAVKAPFTTHDGGVEWMWVFVQRIEGDAIHGEVGNDPMNVPGIKLGSIVQVAKPDIQDWIYMRKNKMIGGYTTKVLMGG